MFVCKCENFEKFYKNFFILLIGSFIELCVFCVFLFIVIVKIGIYLLEL